MQPPESRQQGGLFVFQPHAGQLAQPPHAQAQQQGELHWSQQQQAPAAGQELLSIEALSSILSHVQTAQQGSGQAQRGTGSLQLPSAQQPGGSAAGVTYATRHNQMVAHGQQPNNYGYVSASQQHGMMPGALHQGPRQIQTTAQQHVAQQPAAPWRHDGSTPGLPQSDWDTPYY